jgi:hypothetical protein
MDILSASLDSRNVTEVYRNSVQNKWTVCWLYSVQECDGSIQEFYTKQTGLHLHFKLIRLHSIRLTRLDYFSCCLTRTACTLLCYPNCK